MGSYVSASQIREAAEADESSVLDVYAALATAVSREFDRLSDVPDDHFQAAGTTATAAILRANGTEWLFLGAFVSDSITNITIDGSGPLTIGSDDDYILKGNYLKFPFPVPDDTKVIVTAKWGFAATPSDITQACLEQALFLFRRKDLAFTELSGVSTAAVQAEYSPTFEAVAKQYRSMYGRNGFFA